MFGLGIQELLIILVIVVFLFGGSKLPAVGSALGQGINNFRKSMAGKGEADIEQESKKTA